MLFIHLLSCGFRVEVLLFFWKSVLVACIKQLSFAIDGTNDLKLLTLFSCPFSSYQAVWNIGSLHFRE
jgi:hypothetical protein